MKKIIPLIFAFFFLVACSSSINNSTNIRTDIQVNDFINAFKIAGEPIEKAIEYNEDTDINKLLGRPNQYIKKGNWGDPRVENSDATLEAGTIEIFKNEKDAKARLEYIESVSKDFPSLQTYNFLQGVYLLRLSYDLTPDQAEEFYGIFLSVIIPGSTAAPTIKEITPGIMATEETISEPTLEPMSEPTQEPSSEPIFEQTPTSIPEPTPELTPEPTPGTAYYNSIIKISSISVSHPNSAGGVNWMVQFKNLSDKTINYVEFEVMLINTVGDQIADEIYGYSYDNLVYTGPLAPGKSVAKTFKNAFYNEEIKYTCITDINIEFEDDTTIEIPEEVITAMNIKGNYNMGE